MENNIVWFDKLKTKNNEIISSWIGSEYNYLVIFKYNTVVSDNLINYNYGNDYEQVLNKCLFDLTIFAPNDCGIIEKEALLKENVKNVWTYDRNYPDEYLQGLAYHYLKQVYYRYGNDTPIAIDLSIIYYDILDKQSMMGYTRDFNEIELINKFKLGLSTDVNSYVYKNDLTIDYIDYRLVIQAILNSSLADDFIKMFTNQMYEFDRFKNINVSFIDFDNKLNDDEILNEYYEFIKSSYDHLAWFQILEKDDILQFLDDQIIAELKNTQIWDYRYNTNSTGFWFYYQQYKNNKHIVYLNDNKYIKNINYFDYGYCFVKLTDKLLGWKQAEIKKDIEQVILNVEIPKGTMIGFNIDDYPNGKFRAEKLKIKSYKLDCEIPANFDLSNLVIKSIWDEDYIYKLKGFNKPNTKFSLEFKECATGMHFYITERGN